MSLLAATTAMAYKCIHLYDSYTMRVASLPSFRFKFQITVHSIIHKQTLITLWCISPFTLFIFILWFIETQLYCFLEIESHKDCQVWTLKSTSTSQRLESEIKRTHYICMSWSRNCGSCSLYMSRNSTSCMECPLETASWHMLTNPLNLYLGMIFPL